MKSILIAALLAIVIAGCKSSTSPNDGGTTLVQPNQGSSFKLYNSSTDSTGALSDSSTTVETFQKTGQTMFGKSNVYMIVDSRTDGSGTSDTSYGHYESNGDVSTFLGIGTDGWMTLPFASQGTGTSASFDTVLGFFPAHLQISSVGAGTGSVTINGKSFPTQKVKLNQVVTIFGGTQTIVTTLEFAPALGEVVKSEEPGVRDPQDGSMQSSSHMIVTSYSLK